MKQIGNEQQLIGRSERARIGLLLRVKRIQRIERHELDAGRADRSGRAPASRRLASYAAAFRGSRYACGNPTSSPASSTSAQSTPHVSTPTDTSSTRFDFAHSAACRSPATISRQMPVMSQCNPVGSHTRLVREPMHFLQPQPPALQNADDHPARLGPHINGNVSRAHAAYRIPPDRSDQRAGPYL